MEEPWIYHNSHMLMYRQPFGAVPTQTKVTLRLQVKEISPEEVVCYYILEGSGRQAMPMERVLEGDLSLYSCDLIAPEHPILMWYYFGVRTHKGIDFFGNNDKGLGGVGERTDSPPNSYQITVYQNEQSPPEWFRRGVVYQIFVDRFYNGNEDQRVCDPKKNSLIHAHWENDPLYIKDQQGRMLRWDFFGGNLLGVQKKLTYLKALGVRVIYLNPIFESVSNHKYDTGNYHRIDPMFGNERIFKELCQEANSLGISILLDGVFSHTGSDSKYFNREETYQSMGAYQSKDSPYYNWYRFSRYPETYDCWWGVDTLPNVNELEPSYLDYMIHHKSSVLNFWQTFGIKGWRLDVADELPDRFIQEFRTAMKKNDQESVLIGEVWEDASNKWSHGERRKYFSGNELDSVTNYIFRTTAVDFILGNLSAMDTHLVFYSLFENYPKPHFFSLLNLIGSHDTPRILSVLKENLPDEWTEEQRESYAVKRLKLLALWQLLFPGVPCIYYGDEAGVKGTVEPTNRRTYPWGKENQELLNWYRQIISIRNQYDAFNQGDWEPVIFEGDIYGFRRMHQGTTALVLMNRSTSNRRMHGREQILPDGVKVYDPLQDRWLIWKEHSLIHFSPLEAKVLILSIPQKED